MFSDDSQQESLFKDASWLRTDNGECWVCNGHGLMQGELRKRGITDRNLMQLI